MGNEINNQKSKKYGVLNLAFRTVGLYFKTARWWGVLEQLFATLHSLSWMVGIVATQILFEAITDASVGGLDFWGVFTPLMVLAGITFAQQVLNGVENFTSDQVAVRNEGRFVKMFQSKLQRLSARNFENTEFLDYVNKAKVGAEHIGFFAFMCTQLFSYYTVFFVAIGFYLFSLSPILPLVILAAFIPAMLGQLAQVKIFSKLEKENAPIRRQYEYYQRTIADREFYKETRILGGFKFFHRKFSESLLIVSKKTWKTERKAAIVRLLLNLASFVGLGASIFLLFNAVMAESITIGAFAAVFGSLTRIFYIMEELVTSHIGYASENIGKIENCFRLLDSQEVDGEVAGLDFSKGVVAQNISFTYPGKDEAAIDGVSLAIADGETIAVVGENGAGKSTLVRLLTGIYTPDDGVVEIGGLDSKKTHPNTIFGGISGVFQRYQRYKMTTEENVVISDVLSGENAADVQAALDEAEFNEPDAALDTMLSPEFDGIDLSGGQWQRLAIARGLYRTHDFIVLDEPTAAIDPIEEERIYNQFKRLSADKCAIVVTHRLGSAKLANRIVVMNNGKIDDIGTHDELVMRGGKYADMWNSQAKWYENRA